MNVTAEVRRVSGGKVLAFASAKIEVAPGATILVKNFRVMPGNNGTPWVAFPSESYQKDGETKWSPTFMVLEQKAEGQFLGPVAQAIADAILSEYATGGQSAGASRQQAAQTQNQGQTAKSPNIW